MPSRSAPSDRRRVLYFSRIDLPNPRANSIQSFNTCYEMARNGADVVFVVRHLLRSRRDCFAYYGLPEHPRLRLVSLSLPLPAEFNEWRGKYFGYYLLAFLRRYRRGETLLMTRDPAGLELLRTLRSLAPDPAVRTLFEVHKLAFLTKASHQAERGRDVDDPEVRAKVEARRRLEAEIYAWVDGIVCTTLGAARLLDLHFPSHAPACVVPNGTRLESAPPVSAAALDDTDRDLDVLYVGQLYRWKGVDGLIQAMARLPERRLTIVGGNEPEDRERLEQLAADLGIAARVDFIGQVAPHEVGPYLARARVGVVPLPGEGFLEAAHFTSPLKLFELMTAGVPIVATDLPSIRELLTDGEQALLAAADDPDALAVAIARLLEDRGLARRLVQSAALRVADHGWDARARRILEFATEQTTGVQR